MKEKQVKRVIITLLLVLSLTINGIYVIDENVVLASSNGTVTATSLNVRTGPGTNYSVLQSGGTNVVLKSGVGVSVLKSANGWHNISFSYSGKILNGYVLGSYIKLNSEKNTSDSSLITLKNGKGLSVVYVSCAYTLKLGKDVKATWRTSNSKIATVGITGGELRPIAPGKVTISATSRVTGKTYRKTITVNLRASKLVVSDDLTMAVGEKNQLKAIKNPSNSTDVIRFRTDNAKVATVGLTGGLLTAQGEGEANITVYSKATKASPNTSTYNRVVTFKVTVVPESAQGKRGIPGTVTTASLNVRTGPGTSYGLLKIGNANVVLKLGAGVSVLNSEGGWNYITFTYNGENFSGYVASNYVRINRGEEIYSDSLITINDGDTTRVIYAGKQYPIILGKNVKSIWESSNAKIATVGPTDGGIKAISPGEVTIYATSMVTGKTYKKTYTVNLRATKLEVSENLNMKVGETKKLVAVKTPTNSTDVIRFRTDNAKVATVGLTGGLLTAQGVGEANITVYSKATAESSNTSAYNRVVTFRVTVASESAQGNRGIPATVTTASLSVRTGPGTNYGLLQKGDTNVILKSGAGVSVLNSESGWNYITFTYNGENLSGYVASNYVSINRDKEIYSDSLITINEGNATKVIYTGKQYPIILGKNVKAIWETSDEKIATVDSTDGIIKAIAPGEVSIYATSIVTGKTYKKTYTVNLRAKKLVVSENLTMKIGEKIQLKAVKTPTNSTDVIRFRTDNSRVATVGLTGGLLTAQGVGEANITVYSKATAGSPETSSNNVVVKFKVHVGIDGTVKVASRLTVRTDAGTSNPQLKVGNTLVSLENGKEITVIQEKMVTGVRWYQISFEFNGVILIGYVHGSYVEVDFKEFPDSYKSYLNMLRQQYPKWEFIPYVTGLDWNTVISKEYVPGKGINLIPNGKSEVWKSTHSNDFNIYTGEYKIYDGPYWVAASKAAVSYYMDPRNFLTPAGIFQFEALEYKKEYQTKSGVESILKGTPMYASSFSFLDDVTKKKVTYTYAETFMKAAEASGVSPYHLATRVKQEVVTGSATMSNSVSGMVSGYEGLYNFYNIGATHSTVPGGNIANALNYARSGKSSADIINYGMPWDNPLKSIVGGSKFIGSSYINRGQNTIYLQKFNVTPNSTYSHQYMANVEAAEAESKKAYQAYKDMGDIPIVFYIPVYQNMPDKPCEIPN